MRKNNKINCILSLVICFTVLSVHARAEQSAVGNTENENEEPTIESSEVKNTTDLSEPTEVYEATSRDGELGKSLAQQLNMNQSTAKGPDWMADVASRIQLHGYAQGWYYYQNANGKKSNTFLCKRTLLWANAQITDRWSFLFMHDFNSVVQEYYTDFRVTKNNMLTVRLGQFKNALSYENPLSPTAMETIDVYSEGVTYLTGCGTDALNGVQYGRDQGISLYGETNDKLFRYEVQVMNGSGINMRDKNNEKDVIGRLELRPLKGLNLCATGQLGTGYALAPSVFNPAIKPGDNYTRNRFTVGFDYKSRPFNVHGEYLQGKDGDVTSRGGYVTGNVPLLQFKDKSSIDFVWSYDYFNFNTAQKMDMHKAVAGFQYWFFKKCRFQAQYVFKNANTNYSTSFERGNCHQFICQMQVRFN